MPVPNQAAGAWCSTRPSRRNSRSYRDKRMLRRVNISGTHIFLAIAAGLCMAGPFAWMVIKYWLFAV